MDLGKRNDMRTMPAASRSNLHGVIYQAALHLTGDTLRNLDALRALEWLPWEQVMASQQEYLQRLLMHAWTQVPYYREILGEAGAVSGSGAVRLDRFADIPLLDKVTLHERFEDLKSDDLPDRKWYQNSSGGSTGETATFILDKAFADWGRAIGLLFDSWSGYSPGEPRFLVWPVIRDLEGRKVKPRARLGAVLRNETWLDARRMTTEEMRSFLGRIDKERPAQIYAHPENLFELARFAQSQGFKPSPPKSIVTSGATLFPSMRPTVAEVFDAAIFDRYGSREASGIAAECEAHGGLHVCPVLQHLEVLLPDGSPASPGEIGEVVVTPLTNFAMPLIRYRIGDMAAWAEGPCSCGRAWPLLKEVTGRTRDLFIRGDGTRVRILESVFSRHPWIRRFQVIQEDHNAVRAFIVPHDETENAKKNHAAGIAQVEAAITEVMGPECRVEVILTNQIEASPSGKYLHHISKVRSP